MKIERLITTANIPDSGVQRDANGHIVNPIVSQLETTTGSKFVTSINNTNIRLYNNVAQFYKGGGTQVGAILITLPYGWSTTMMSIHIIGYEYNSNAGWDMYVSGYSSPYEEWRETSALLVGESTYKQVQFGYDGTHCVIILGNVTDSANYIHIAINDVVVGVSTIDGWETGWNIEMVTDISNITSIVTPAIQKVWDTQNDGAGSGLDADMLQAKYPSVTSSANTIVQRDANGDFSAGTITATLSGSASQLKNTYLQDILFNTGNAFDTPNGTQYTGNITLTPSSITARGNMRIKGSAYYNANSNLSTSTLDLNLGAISINLLSLSSADSKTYTFDKSFTYVSPSSQQNIALLVSIGTSGQYFENIKFNIFSTNLDAIQ